MSCSQSPSSSEKRARKGQDRNTGGLRNGHSGEELLIPVWGGGLQGVRRGVSDGELEHVKTQRWERRTPIRSHEVMVKFENMREMDSPDPI